MRIGFTYDLKDDYIKAGFTAEEAAEFDSIITINAVDSAITQMGHTVVRIGNAASLMERLLAGERWDLVFNIAEGVRGSGRESLVPALLDAYKIPYTFSDPLTHAITLNKAITKQILRDSKIPTADFMLVHSADSMPKPKFPYPCFVKPTSEGTGKGITPKSKVYDYGSLVNHARELIMEFKQPVIVEPFLIGREVTVGILGTGESARCAGVMEVSFTDKADSDIHSYYNKEFCEIAAKYDIVDDDFAKLCAKYALEAHKALNIKDACRVDMRADASGEPFIMEINTLPGLMPERSDLVLLCTKAGMKYDDIIENIINSAVLRL
jgi:D-alanine-D-alanine ligase